jgi:hypothetical protein
MGRTNMSEFAFSGVGVNPHHGTPANPADPGDATHPGRLVVRRRRLGGRRRRLHRPGLGHRRLDPHPGRAVRHRRLQEHGAADAAGRRPAPVHHAGHRLRHDASVRDAVLAHEILADRRCRAGRKPLAQHRFAVATHADAGRPGRHRGPAFERARWRMLRRPARASTRSRWRHPGPGHHPGHRRLRRRRELCLAPPAAGRAWRRLRPARAHPHRARRRHEGLGVHRPAQARAAWIAA